MTFRFTYSADGRPTYTATGNPSGWDGAKIGFERDPKMLSLVEFFKSSFALYGNNGRIYGARSWFLDTEAANGPDSVITQLIEIDDNDDGNWEYFFQSVFAIETVIESYKDSHLVDYTLSQQDFWAKFIKRFNTPVDLKSVVDLDGNAVAAVPSFTLPLPGQKIIKSYSAYLKFNQVFQIRDITNLLFYVGFDTEQLKEIIQQSSLTLSLVNGADGSLPDATDPRSYNKVIPYFDVDDAGDFEINKLQFTMSQGPQRDSAYAGGADYVNTTNDKNTKMTNVDFYIQVNTNVPIKLTKAYRAVANFVRNDGVNETLFAGASDPYVTDYSLPGTTLILRKFDAVKIFGIYNDEFTFPFRIDNGLVWMWGTDGWDHDSGYDQMRGGQGNYNKWRGAGTIHDDANRGDFAWGGLFAPAGAFPNTIDDEGGTGLAIKASQWWNVAQAGFVVGGTVLIPAGKVIQAKVNAPGDVLADWYIWDKSPYEGLEAYGTGNGFEVAFNTSLADSSCDAFLTHDVARGIIERITAQDLFISEYLGNSFTSVIYPFQGCGSFLANMLGLHLRGYSLADKPLQMSMQDWWDGINPLHCLGLGYEKVGGVDKIVCEFVDHFFDDSAVSIRFMNIADIKRSYDTEWQFNQLEFGNTKWQSQAATGIGSPSGIDDPQSQRSWTTRFKIIGKKLSQLSKWVLASLTIETTRRVGINQSSNYTYDNDVFGIALFDNGGSLIPETDENFSLITNLLNSPTRYNSSMTPARSLLRWRKYWSGCLQDYLASFVNFASGVGNFLMTSTKTTACPGDSMGNSVPENGNFPIPNDYLFLPTPLEINHYIDWPTYKVLRDHKNLAIEISQTEAGFTKCFIKTFEYDKTNGKCSMVVWPKTKFTIQELESMAVGGERTPGVRYFEIAFGPEFE